MVPSCQGPGKGTLLGWLTKTKLRSGEPSGGTKFGDIPLDPVVFCLFFKFYGMSVV